MAGTPTRVLPAAWGILGVLAILGVPIWRLAPVAWEPLQTGPIDARLILLYIGGFLFLGYTEGYKAFQLQFSPRVVARAIHLGRNPRWHHVLLAPLYCMTLIHATPKRILVSWGVVVGVTGLILLVKITPQPWRGAIDAGVILGLSWGIVVILVYTVRGMLGREIDHEIDLPKSVV